MLQSRVVVVGGVEVACQNPAQRLAQRLVHHLPAPAPAQEVPLRRCAEGPNVAVDSILPPASLVSVHYRAATDALQRFSDSRSAMPGNLMDGPDDGPNAQLQLVERSQIPLNCPYGQPPLFPQDDNQAHQVDPQALPTYSQSPQGGLGQPPFPAQRTQPGHEDVLCDFRWGHRNIYDFPGPLHPSPRTGWCGIPGRTPQRAPSGGRVPSAAGQSRGDAFSGALFSAADAPCQPACGPASCPLDRRRTAGPPSSPPAAAVRHWCPVAPL